MLLTLRISVVVYSQMEIDMGKNRFLDCLKCVPKSVYFHEYNKFTVHSKAGQKYFEST